MKTGSIERSKPYMLRVSRPPIFLNHARLEGLRIMRIDDDTIGLLEVANEKLEQSDLHLEPHFVFIRVHHLEEGRSNICDFLRPGKMQVRRDFARLGIVER